MIAESVVKRFWPKVNKTDGCWEWTGAKVGGGYGVLWIDGKNKTATSISLAIKTGSMPASQVLHSCDNPPCVNPEHLREGDQKENIAEAIAKGRFPQAYRFKHKTACPKGHPYDEKNTRRYVDKIGKARRECRSCDKMRPRRGKW